MARYFGTNIISKDISGLTSSQYAAINSTITKAKVDDIVTLTTAQDISGKKNFTNDVNVTKSIPTLEIKDSNSSADLTLTSRSTTYSGARVRLLDCKGKKVTSIYNTYSTTGDAYTKIQHNSKSGKTIELGLGFDANEVGIATAPTPTTTTDQASTQIATTGWVNKKGNNVVHLSDAETITGAKTFTSEIKGRFRSASYHQGENNDNSWFKLGTFQSTGTYHNQILIFTLWQGTDGDQGTVSGRIFTRTGGNNVAGAFSSAGIEFDYKPTWLNFDNFKLLYKEDQGTTNKYVLFELWVKTPSAYTGGVISILDERASAELYSTSWVLYTKPTGIAALPTDYVAISSKLANHNIALNSDVVHIANAETITGAKTFAGGQVTKFKDNTNTIGTYTTDTWSTSSLYFSDSTGARIARLQPAYVTGTNILKMGMYASNSNTAEQGITIRSDGVTSAPMQAATNSTTSNGIATIGWVNDPTKSTNVVHRSGGETISGSKTFSSTITSSITSGSYLAGNQGKAIINSTASAGGYTMLAKMNTTNGYMTLGTYQGRCELHYTAKTTVDAGTNSCTHQVTLLDESGNSTFPGTITAPTFNGTATKAKWADLAENYVSDKIYPIGTLIKFGGEADITIADDNCNGAISDKPGYLLDAELEGGQPIALVGKTPIRIIGKINKHDKVTLSEIPGVGRVATEGEKVIARALESSDNDDEKLIMCVTKFNLD